ncbi:MAG: UDP-3-O-(3-hydroxymyristoyl)glucosamine N-acyltransferase [Bacteroidetes bacterium]|nr:UDP-3-O-(3-hydroxymyristoyl)glucosamine N-acyltransferase [Bacteroidota bacterium]
MQFSAQEICQALDGRLEGDPEIKVNKPAKIEEGGEGSISFVANPKYEQYIYSTTVSVLIINQDLKLEKAVTPAIIWVNDAYGAFTKVLELFNGIAKDLVGIDDSCKIEESADIGKDVYFGAFTHIGANAVIGDKVKIHPGTYIGDNAKIGAGSVLLPGVKIYDDCEVGMNCILHGGVVVGCDGFGFAPQTEGAYQKIPQLGNVIIEDKVEIGSNTTIDRATVGSTIIRKGVKLDNLIQVAHNVEIGENTVIAAQTGISGSTKLGKNCMVGGQVGFVGHVTIANGVRIGARSGISKSIKEEGSVWNGSPAFGYQDSLRSHIIFKRLPSVEERIKILEEKIKSLEDNR